MELYSETKMNPTKEEKQYAMLMHLLQLTGWVVPLVLWLVKRDTSDYINENGKIVMNWIISSIIYAIAGCILLILLVGIPMLIALGVCHIVFAILGGIRANEGTLWPYPLTIKFIK